MKHIQTFESFLNESVKVELADKKMTDIKKGDKLTLTDAAKEEYKKTKPHMKKILDDVFTFDSMAGGALRVIGSDGDSFIIDGSRFQMNESLNEMMSASDTTKAADLINKEIGADPGYFFLGDEDAITQFNSYWSRKMYRQALNMLIGIESLKDLQEFIEENK